MKILTVYASAGAGHEKCAKAIHEHLKATFPDAQCETVDILDKANFLFRFTYRSGYGFMIRHSVWLWAFIFKLTGFKPLRILSRSVAGFLDWVNTPVFRRFLKRENPDYIVSTHFLPPEIAGGLKRSKSITSKLFTVITDFGVHPFWIESSTDLYIVASGFTKQALIEQGVPEGNIQDSGIPVRTEFLKKHDRAYLCKKLGIEDTKFTVLVMTGSFGIGPIREITEMIHGDVQLLVVCAMNKKLYGQLKAKDFPGVKVYGFVDNSDELMAVSDLIITKPGGLSVSEILNTGLVPVFISSIPGQEEENISVLLKAGIGFAPENTEEIKSIVLDLKNNPQKLNALKAGVRSMSKPDCLKGISDAICKNSVRAAA